MTIANIILTSQNGGAEQVFLDYIKILQKLNYPVCAFIRDNAPYISQLSALNIPTQQAKQRFGYYDFFFIAKLKKFLLQEKVKAAEAIIRAQVTFFIRLVFIFFDLLIFKTLYLYK